MSLQKLMLPLLSMQNALHRHDLHNMSLTTFRDLRDEMNRMVSTFEQDFGVPSLWMNRYSPAWVDVPRIEVLIPLSVLCCPLAYSSF